MNILFVHARFALEMIALRLDHIPNGDNAHQLFTFHHRQVTDTVFSHGVTEITDFIVGHSDDQVPGHHIVDLERQTIRTCCLGKTDIVLPSLTGEGNDRNVGVARLQGADDAFSGRARKGIGSRLMDCAAGFLKGRAHVMMVYRGGELSRGYQYYARNNHYDVVYVRRWEWETPDAKPSEHVKVHNIDEMYRREAKVIEVFNSCYGKFGGYPLRRPGHYEMMLHNANWEEVKHDWRFLELTSDGKPMGYLLAHAGT